MMKRAFIFPGQASQEVGMAQDIYEAHDSIKKLYKKAGEILGFNVANISFEGPFEALTETKVTQPAIFTASAALFSLLPKTYTFDMTAGHSLGEFTALFAAGVMSFEDALKIVKVRAEAMQIAGEEKAGTMAAIINLSREDMQLVIKHSQLKGIVQTANFNAPGQIVISGEKEAVKYAMEAAKTAGAKKALELSVSGAFHSPLMESAKDALKRVIRTVEFKTAKVPVYCNVDGLGTTDPKKLEENLILQIDSPVLWEDSVNQMVSDGATEFVEIGPGRVLQGLVKRINREVAVRGISNLAEIKGLGA